MPNALILHGDILDVQFCQGTCSALRRCIKFLHYSVNVFTVLLRHAMSTTLADQWKTTDRAASEQASPANVMYSMPRANGRPVDQVNTDRAASGQASPAIGAWSSTPLVDSDRSLVRHQLTKSLGLGPRRLCQCGVGSGWKNFWRA